MQEGWAGLLDGQTPGFYDPVRNFWRVKKIFVKLLTRLTKNEKPTVAVIGRKGGTYKTQLPLSKVSNSKPTD